MNADQIISINQPERLFSSTLDAAKSEYKSLISQWHPDQSSHSMASDVSAHINTLYRQAVEKIKAGTWESATTLSFSALNGIEHNYAFRKKRDTETGTMWSGEHIIYRVDTEFEDLFKSGIQSIRQLKFQDAAMRKQFAPQLPLDSHLVDAKYMVNENVNKDILLTDLIEHAPIPARHLAWIISRLLNLRCYLQHIGMTHNCIDANSIAVNPEKHWIWLCGGWWYSRPIGDRLLALPANLISCAPSSVLKDKQAASIIDGEQIRFLARQLLKSDAPQAMKNWAKHPAGENAVKDYQYWRESVLIDSFGKIEFADYDVSFNNVYGV